MAIFKEGQVVLQFFANETDLLAGTSQWLSSPLEGEIAELEVVVQKTVTTGGTVTVKNAAGTTVASLTATVANGATAGTKYNDTTDLNEPTRRVKKGDKIEIVLDAAFALAGALNGWVRIVGSGKYVT